MGERDIPAVIACRIYCYGTAAKEEEESVRKNDRRGERRRATDLAHATAIMEKRAFTETLTASWSGFAGTWKQYPLKVREALALSEMWSLCTA